MFSVRYHFARHILGETKIKSALVVFIIGAVEYARHVKQAGIVYDGRIVGYDVDFLVAFAKEYGYKLDIEEVAFPSLLAGLQTGIYDLSIAGLSITEERMETIDFSDPYHREDMIFIINGDNSSSLDQFNGATLGVVTGSLYGGYSREQFPNATIKEFNTFADVLVALKGGKVDGIMLDKAKDFAVDIVNLCRLIKETKRESVLTNQLLRSSTSIGANIHEAQYAASKAKADLDNAQSQSDYYKKQLAREKRRAKNKKD